MVMENSFRVPAISFKEHLYRLLKNNKPGHRAVLIREAAKKTGLSEYTVAAMLEERDAAMHITPEQRKVIMGVFGYSVPEVRDPYLDCPPEPEYDENVDYLPEDAL